MLTSSGKGVAMRSREDLIRLGRQFGGDEPPLKLYRYRSLDKNDRFQQFVDTLAEDRVWFAKPPDFNDPFECQFVMSFDASSHQKMQRYARYLREHEIRKGTAASRAGKKFFRDKGLKGTREWEEERLRLFTEKLLHGTGMLCLSAINYDILMWSHYADAHRGICLEFTMQGQEPGHMDFFARTFPVHYQDEVPSFNFYKPENELEIVRATVLTKASHWKYEEEYRIVDMRQGPGMHALPKGIISGVILGLRMPEEQRQRVREVVKGCGTEILVYEARRREGAYGLQICPT